MTCLWRPQCLSSLSTLLYKPSTICDCKLPGFSFLMRYFLSTFWTSYGSLDSPYPKYFRTPSSWKLLLPRRTLKSLFDGTPHNTVEHSSALTSFPQSSVTEINSSSTFLSGTLVTHTWQKNFLFVSTLPLFLSFQWSPSSFSLKLKDPKLSEPEQVSHFSPLLTPSFPTSVITFSPSISWIEISSLLLDP